MAVLGYFATDPRGEGPWRTRVAPALSLTGLTIILVVVLGNYATLIGVEESSPLRWGLPAVYAVTALGGYAYGLHLRAHRPGTYHAIGHGARAALATPDPFTDLRAQLASADIDVPVGRTPLMRFPVTLIRPAITRDVDDVARLLAQAFGDPEPVTRWLVPDPVRHAVVMPTFFEVFAQDALTHGTIDLATDHDGTLLGAAIWFDHTTPDPSGAAGGPDPRLDEAFGPDASRWQALDAAMTATHPDAPHAFG